MCIQAKRNQGKYLHYLHYRTTYTVCITELLASEVVATEAQFLWPWFEQL
jgi:hypothetical protein